MTTDQIRYALAKQVQTIHGVYSDYGEISLLYLDEKDRERVAAALRKGLENELRRRKAEGVQP